MDKNESGLFSLNNKKKKLARKRRLIFSISVLTKKIFAYGSYTYYRREEASHQEVTDICKQYEAKYSDEKNESYCNVVISISRYTLR